MQRENWFMSDKISSKMQFPLRGKRQKRGFELVILNVKCAGMGRGGARKLPRVKILS